MDFHFSKISKYNGLTISPEYFDDAMTKLREEFLNVPVEMVLHPFSRTDGWDVDIQESANKLSITLKKDQPGQSWFHKAYKLDDNRNEQIRCYTEAIKVNPSFTEAYYNRGISRSQIGDFEGAIQDYTEAIRLKPDHANAFWGRGNALRSKKDYASAVADYQKYFELGGNDERVRKVMNETEHDING